MMKCHNCGAPILEEAKFCSKCGTPKSVEELIVEIEEPVKQSIKPAKSSTVFFSKKVITVLAVLVIGGGVGFGVKKIFFSSNDSVRDSIDKENTKKVTKQRAKQPISFKNGNGFGLMDQNLNVMNENIGQSPVVFNEFNVGITYQQGKVSMINTKGEKIIDENYSTIGTFNSPKMGMYEMARMQSKKGTMDFTVADDSSDEGYTTLTGLIDVKGNVVLEPGEYSIFPFYGKTLTTFYRNGKTGIVSEDGEFVVEAINDQAVVLSDKLIAVKKDNDNSTFKVMNLKGEVVQETSYEQLYSGYNNHDYFTVTNTLGKVGIVDSELNEIVPPTSASYLTLSNDARYIVFTENDKYGIKTIDGEIIIQASYDYLTAPNENGVVSFSKDEDTFGLMTLKEEIIDDSFESNLYPAYMTNLFYTSPFDEEQAYTTMYNDKGEEIGKEKTLPAYNPIFPVNTYPLPIYDGENITEDNPIKLIVFNKDGLVLSEEATFLFDMGDSVMIQEDMHIKLVNKNNGKVIKETDL